VTSTPGWRLRVEFRTPAEQEEIDPEYAFPHDDMTRFVAHVTERWGLMTEELAQPGADDSPVSFWTETVIVLESEVIDAFDEIMNWLIMSTSPMSIHLDRII
jgi:hypothetical protein